MLIIRMLHLNYNNKGVRKWTPLFSIGLSDFNTKAVLV